jgi:hypothetical protein
MTEVFTEAPTVGTPEPVPVGFDRESAEIYYYGGHGEDLCDRRTKLPIIRLVPENCIYITISECGFSTEIKGGEEDFFRSVESDRTLRYPEVGGNKLAIANILQQKPNWVHIHMPGTPYVASFLSPFSYWSRNQFAGLAQSGLCNKKKLETMGSRAKYTYRDIPYISKPQTGKQILNRLNHLPYAEEKKTEARRLMGIRMVQKVRSKEISPDKQDSYLDYSFTKKEAYDILLAVYYMATKDELLTFFEASDYPTKAEVDAILRQAFPGQTRFFSGNFEAIKHAIEDRMNPRRLPLWDRRHPLSNTYLMENFPGIHYNVVCRAVNDTCFLGLHRTLSGKQETERMGQNYPMTATQDYDQIKKSIEDIVTSSNSNMKKRQSLKTLLSKRATNVYLTKEEEKQALYDYLLEKRFLTRNTNRETANSLVMKYYLMPDKYRLRTLGGSTRKKRRGTRKQK